MLMGDSQAPSLVEINQIKMVGFADHRPPKIW